MPLKTTPSKFPKNFAWGFATAAPQIEGAAFEDGKGWSAWDDFSRQPGRVRHGETPDIACDHYHRFDDDFRLMRSLGARHYRLSLAWTRILPAGAGAVNQAGIDFYHRLFDSLERHGITPWVTLFHWDTPLALDRAGGWSNRAIVDAFARYAEIVVRAYGSRVKNWITLNEIPCFTARGYGKGADKPPGRPSSPQVVNQTIHHALLAHGHGVRAVREFGGRGARVGLAENATGYIPVTETEPDVSAAREAFGHANDFLLGTTTRGRYSERLLRLFGRDRPVVQRGDLALIGEPTDFLGLNIYFAEFVRAIAKKPGYEVLPYPPGYPQTTPLGWLKTTPQALYWTPRFAAEVFGFKTLYITENGYGTSESPNAAGEIHDLHRRDYMRQYLRELHRVIADGLVVKGYFAWSFLDNFEWNDGYDLRFGVCYTDYKTLRRTPKLSARWYGEVMRRNALV